MNNLEQDLINQTIRDNAQKVKENCEKIKKSRIKRIYKLVDQTFLEFYGFNSTKLIEIDNKLTVVKSLEDKLSEIVNILDVALYSNHEFIVAINEQLATVEDELALNKQRFNDFQESINNLSKSFENNSINNLLIFISTILLNLVFFLLF